MATAQVQNDPVITLPTLNINGLIVSNDATTPNTKVNISAGTARDSNNMMDITLGSTNANLEGSTVTAPLVVDTATVGANGIDTGTLAASKVYAVYVIADSRYYKPTAGLVSLSLTAPQLPFGYDSFRLVGYAVTDSSVHFLKMYIAGTGNYRQFFYDSPQATAITAGAATTYTAITLTTLVPSIDNTPITVFSALTPSAAGRGVFLQGANYTGDPVINLGQVTSVVLNSFNTVVSQLVSGVPKINYKVSNASDAVNIKISAFTFFV